MPSQPKPIRALVVDDEAPARTRLTDLLAKDPDFGRILEAQNGVAAVEIIQGVQPDIVFLDMQMPDVDGLGVIGAIGANNMPLTVFVTAYDRFALQAFDADAIDYLLKPFGDERFERAVDRVKGRLHDLRSTNSKNAGCFGPELVKLVEKRTKPGEIWEWIAVKSRDATRLIMTEDIDWIEGAGVYVTLHVKGQEFCYRASMATIASRLDPFRFVRIHRSSIVNLRSVDRLERRSHGEFDVMLKDGGQLMITRSYRSHFEAMLGQRL